MTNLQGNAPNPWIARLLLWMPASIGALLAVMVLAIGAFPLISQLQIQGRQQQEKLAQEQRLPQLRSTLRRTAEQQRLAESQQQRLLELIAGSGDLVTFMAQADREARRHGVELQLYEPNGQQASAAETAAAAQEADPLKPQDAGTRKKRKKKAKERQQAEAEASGDPMLDVGLKRNQVLLSAQGSYPNVLQFLRALEGLGLLVVQSNLNLSTAETAKDSKSTQGAAAGTVQLKVAVTLYSRGGQR